MKARALQNAHAELICKKRELDDAWRELDLSVETRVPGIAWGCACESQTRARPRACETDLTESRLFVLAAPFLLSMSAQAIWRKTKTLPATSTFSRKCRDSTGISPTTPQK